MKLFNWFKGLFKKEQPKSSVLNDEQETLIKKVGAVTLYELNRSRKLRRKIKGTAFEMKITNLLKK
jgi:hypothetical protein